MFFVRDSWSFDDFGFRDFSFCCVVLLGLLLLWVVLICFSLLLGGVAFLSVLREAVLSPLCALWVGVFFSGNQPHPMEGEEASTTQRRRRQATQLNST